MLVDDTLKELELPLYGDHALAIQHYEVGSHGLCFPIHWHNRVEILRVSTGSMLLTINHAECFLDSGNLAIVTPRQVHGGVAGDDGVDYDVLMFDTSNFLINAAGIKSILLPLSDGRLLFDKLTSEPTLLGLFDRIMSEGDQHPIAAIGYLMCFLDAAIQYCHPVQSKLLQSDARFLEVIAYIDAHFMEPLTVCGVSSLFGYDESYFCRRFHITTGITMLRYVEILRLEKARYRIISSDTPIGVIALECGFKNISHFSTRFSKHFCLSPSQLRRNKKDTR